MHMGMSMSMGQHMEQRMSVAQRMEERLALRLELLEALHGVRYQPEGDCPRCHRKLTKVEILRGFNNDPNDFTTRCTGCGCRFQPKLVHSTPISRAQVPFFCPSQTLHQLRGKEVLSAEELQRQYPAIFQSARVHFGSLAAAFARNSVSYALEMIEHWKGKVRGFLGKLTDKLIAECVGAPVKDVRAYRRELKIPCYNARR